MFGLYSTRLVAQKLHETYLRSGSKAPLQSGWSLQPRWRDLHEAGAGASPSAEGGHYCHARLSMNFVHHFSALTCFVLAACAASPRDGVAPPTADAEPPRTDAGGDTSRVVANCDGLGKAALPTAACCRAFGIDACGAGFVCAALDGRTQPVCYAEKSRLGGQECDSAQLCQSGVCLATRNVCAGSRGYRCRTTADCIDGLHCSQSHYIGEPSATRPKGWDTAAAPSCLEFELSTYKDTSGNFSRSYESCITDADCTGKLTNCQPSLNAPQYSFCY